MTLKWSKLKLQYPSTEKRGDILPPPPQKKNIYILVKNEKGKDVPNYLKWRENWSKISFGFLIPLSSKRKFEKVLDDKK